MTQVSAISPTKRETAATERGRALIVSLFPGFLEIRAKGRRTAVAVDYRAILDLGYKLMARAARAEKLAAKGAGSAKSDTSACRRKRSRA